MNRLVKRLADLNRLKKKALIAYCMAGDPSLSVTERAVYALESSGVDVVELGVPFSDPVADGPVIQQAGVRAIKRGVTLNKVFELSARIRSRSNLPLILMLYYNLILNVGFENFMSKASRSGIDGLIVPDLTVEESASLLRAAKRYNISLIFFVAPTTGVDRLKKIAAKSNGFIYYISRTGVTGEATRIVSKISADVGRIKKLTSVPVMVGFGIKTRAQIKDIYKVADGAIVGSALVELISSHKNSDEIVKNIKKFIGGLRV